MKYSEKNKFIKETSRVPLLNFEGSPGVLLLNFEGRPGVPFLNFRGSRILLLTFEEGPEVSGPEVLFPVLHHAGRSYVNANISVSSIFKNSQFHLKNYFLRDKNSPSERFS